jgi:hypothetical protein
VGYGLFSAVVRKGGVMTDERLLELLEQIDEMNDEIGRALLLIEFSDHPNAKAVTEALKEKGFDNSAWAYRCFRPSEGDWILVDSGWVKEE